MGGGRLDGAATQAKMQAGAAPGVHVRRKATSSPRGRPATSPASTHSRGAPLDPRRQPTAVPARARRRTQDERSAETREKLLLSAVHAIAQHGYAAATTSVIAERADVSRGALQYHFRSKDDLIVAMMEVVAVELNFRLDTSALRTRRLEDRVETLIEHYWEIFQGPLFRAALSVWLIVGDNPALASRIDTSLKPLRGDISHVWHELFADVGRSDEELTSLLRVVQGAVRGAAVAQMAGRSAHDLQEDRRQLARMAVLALMPSDTPAGER